ncbi:hypothetical protein HK100_007496 [Physocladia obscura]|uniref:Uncharacterized protein n=1 Tax=Physocladia obscura TaxID=109957 RepID=A0AAD5T599_9FUNG|nr:hypothetical protein HK100_007496 [Physocladia obscura]
MKRLQNFVTFLLPISPLFFYAQVIPELALAFNTGEYSQDAVRAIEYTCPLLAGTGAVIFDTIFLYAFCAHLSATGMIDLEFMTIRKYGIITCLLCYLSLGLYVLAAAVPELENDYTLIVVVCNGIFLVIFGVMFQMKIAMRELAESERAESVDVVRKNIQESRKELSSQRKNTSSPLIFVTSA